MCENKFMLLNKVGDYGVSKKILLKILKVNG